MPSTLVTLYVHSDSEFAQPCLPGWQKFEVQQIMWSNSVQCGWISNYLSVTTSNVFFVSYDLTTSTGICPGTGCAVFFQTSPKPLVILCKASTLPSNLISFTHTYHLCRTYVNNFLCATAQQQWYCAPNCTSTSCPTVKFVDDYSLRAFMNEITPASPTAVDGWSDSTIDLTDAVAVCRFSWLSCIDPVGDGTTRTISTMYSMPQPSFQSDPYHLCLANSGELVPQVS